ncbi:MAG: hypothetical protein EPN36_13885 [Rhodanobacteraceae bacterium]|nr:MAG: hypothetical protein EPN36_13885 [Rhodanobacteraceae bacterium]
MSTDVKRQRSDESAMDEITKLMSGTDWSPDTLDEIAGIVRETGREITDTPSHDYLEEPGVQS